MPLAFSILLLLAIYLFLTLLLNINQIEEYKPMEKVLYSQAFSQLDVAIIYKALDVQIKLNNQLLKNSVISKEKEKEIKTVNKEIKNTLKKVKVIAKEAGVEL